MLRRQARKPFEHLAGPLHERLLLILPFFHQLCAQGGVLGAFLEPFLHHFQQAIGVGLHVNGTHMQHHGLGLDAGRRFNGLDRMAPRVLLFAPVRG